MIEFVNVNYIYKDGSKDFQALKDINLKIDKGEFIGIVGRTGSGKSTLIQMMNGIYTPETGEVLYDGENINSKGYDKRQLKFKVGMVFQYPEYQLFENEVLEDVKYGPKNKGMTDGEAAQEARYALDLLGFPKEKYAKSPFELSGGEKKRVAIAGILAMKPEVLVLDEPTAGLDPEGRKTLLELLKRLQVERNMTVVIVSHSMEDMAEYADRLIVMNEGTIYMDDTTKNIFSEYEKIEKVGLAAPQITYIMAEMKKRGYDVDTSITTMEEAVKCLEKLL